MKVSNNKPTFANPVKNPVVTSEYGPRILNGHNQFHDGVDYVSATGEKAVFALYGGQVCHDMDYYEASKAWTDSRHSLGNFVIVKHVIEGKLYYVRYCHLGRNVVKQGQHVQKGQLLGHYANAGMSYGAHLHLDGYDYKWRKKWGIGGNFSKVLKEYGINIKKKR